MASARGMEQEVKRDREGFRLRGLHTTRIETFTDAAFAFALTLLVISLEPLNSFAALQAGLAGIPPFVASAAILMMFWWGHHGWSRRYGLDDGPTLVLSCCLVFTLLVYVYPLRFVFALMMEWICQLMGVKLGTGAMISSPADVNRAFVIYGIGFAAMSLSLLLLHWHAWRCREELELDAAERADTRATMGVWAILMAAGLLSMTVALLLPPSMVGAPGWVYALLGIVMPIYGKVSSRRRAKLLASR